MVNLDSDKLDGLDGLVSNYMEICETMSKKFIEIKDSKNITVAEIRDYASVMNNCSRVLSTLMEQQGYSRMSSAKINRLTNRVESSPIEQMLFKLSEMGAGLNYEITTPIDNSPDWRKHAGLNYEKTIIKTNKKPKKEKQASKIFTDKIISIDPIDDKK
jgi:hypothetical protein